MSAEQEIRTTLATYCQRLDDGRFDDWVEVFSDDVVFAVMGRVGRGRQAVRDLIEPYQQAENRGRHLLSEPLIHVDGDSAVVTTDYAFVSKDLTVSSSGRYHDRFVHDGERWLISEREIVFLGDEPKGFFEEAS